MFQQKQGRHKARLFEFVIVPHSYVATSLFSTIFTWPSFLVFCHFITYGMRSLVNRLNRLIW